MHIEESGGIAWLLKHMGIRPEEILDRKAFLKRLRVQKGAFLLKYLGVSPFTSYEFSMYISGPYSPLLAKTYYNLQNVTPIAPKTSAEVLSLLDWFMNHDDTWLEVASSIISLKENNSKLSKHGVYEILLLSKPWVGLDLFNKVFADLSEKSLVKWQSDVGICYHLDTNYLGCYLPHAETDDEDQTHISREVINRLRYLGIPIEVSTVVLGEYVKIVAEGKIHADINDLVSALKCNKLKVHLPDRQRLGAYSNLVHGLKKRDPIIENNDVLIIAQGMTDKRCAGVLTFEVKLIESDGIKKVIERQLPKGRKFAVLDGTQFMR